MSLISGISFLLLFLIILYSLKQGTDTFSPSKVFLIIWTTAIGLADLKFSRLQHEWSTYGWIMLLISISSFLLGFYIIYVISFGKEILSITEIRKIIRSQEIDERKFFKIITIIFIVYAVSYLLNTLIEGYIPLFYFRPSESRVFWGVFGLGLLVHAVSTLMLLIIQYFILVDNQPRKKIILFIFLFVTFVTYFFLLQRFDLMFGLIMIFVFTYYSSNFFRPRNTFIMFAILFGLVFGVQFIRFSKFVTNFLYYYSEMKFSIKYAIFTEPYMYISMNLENFARAVTRLENHSFGYYTFNFIMSLSGLKHVLSEYANLVERPFLNSDYNTYTMFWDFYRDFGIPGIAIIPLILGMGISHIYHKMRSDPNIVTLSLYAISVFILFISFFLNALGLLHFIFNVVLIIFVTKYINKTKVFTK